LLLRKPCLRSSYLVTNFLDPGGNRRNFSHVRIGMTRYELS